ncbi:HNH endonuclease [Alteromonas australica]|tara:strand:- start:3290 stop:3526 length:237 start_codon:yes stop_codon:yes gene_type:complete
MEAHHLIPMEFQDDFEHSIDVPENIISLCPTCHRLFHHASDCEKKEIIEKFFDKRSAALSFERGVMIKKDTLLRYYKV